MDNNINLITSVHHQQRKSTKKPNKTKKTSSNKPVKVVYISNPMKVKTSASKFRALVQELTGQDAEFPDPNKFPATEDDGAVTGDPTVKMGSSSSLDLDHDGVVVEIDMSSSGSLEQQQQVESSSTANIITTTTTSNNNNTSLEAFDDDVFMPQMMDSLSGILPSSVWYESPQLDAIRSSLDAII